LFIAPRASTTCRLSRNGREGQTGTVSKWLGESGLNTGSREIVDLSTGNLTDRS
jgi:hypothetical protein